MFMLGIAVSLSSGATDGGGVTPIGIPFGMSIVYENPGPYSAFQESPFGFEWATGFLNETATFLFPQYPGRLDAPDTGEAFADDMDDGTPGLAVSVIHGADTGLPSLHSSTVTL